MSDSQQLSVSQSGRSFTAHLFDSASLLAKDNEVLFVRVAALPTSLSSAAHNIHCTTTLLKHNTISALSSNRCLSITGRLFGATVNTAYSVNIPLIKPTINIAIPGKLRRWASLRRAREVNVGAALGRNSDLRPLHQSRWRGTGWFCEWSRNYKFKRDIYDNTKDILFARLSLCEN